MQAFTAEKTELLATYGADANRGLTEAQAQKNKEQYGANALTRRKPDTLLKRLWDAATEPMLLMLIAAGLIALAVFVLPKDEDEARQDKQLVVEDDKDRVVLLAPLTDFDVAYLRALKLGKDNDNE